jgi:hypothetical protein
MYASHLWDKSFKSGDKILYEQAREVVTRKKGEDGKTKTDLIRDFVDFKGDKWKYLLAHPKTRMALCTSGDAQWNGLGPIIQSINTTVNNLIIDNGGTVYTGQIINFAPGSCVLMSSYPNALSFPLQFKVSFTNTNQFSNFNIGFLTNAYNAGTQSVGLNYNGYGASIYPSNETGFALTLNSSGNQVILQSVAVNQVALFQPGSANVITTPIPGIPVVQNGTNYLNIRIPGTGNQIGWNTSGSSWTYYSVPQLNLRSLKLSLVTCALSSIIFGAGSQLFQISEVTGSLANAP